MIKIYNYKEIRENPEKFEEVFSYIRKYGSHTMAYSVLQPKMNYFILEGVGFLAYAKLKKSSNRRYVLSDPVCEVSDVEPIFKVFLSKYPKTSFVQVSPETSKILNKLGFYATPMGVETFLKLDEFSISKSKKKNLRNSIRNCKGKVMIYEHNELENINQSDIKKISQEWLRTQKRGKKELRFLARPFIDIEERDTRRFFAFKDNKMVGFIIFNPIYLSEKIIGYSQDILRVSSEAPRGTGDYLLYLAIKKLKREKYIPLNLGMSPFYGLEKDRLKKYDNQTLSLLRLIYDKGSFLYGFRGLAEHKIQFEGQERNTYFCHKNKLPLIDIISLFKICNAI